MRIPSTSTSPASVKATARLSGFADSGLDPGFASMHDDVRGRVTAWSAAVRRAGALDEGPTGQRRRPRRHELGSRDACDRVGARQRRDRGRHGSHAGPGGCGTRGHGLPPGDRAAGELEDPRGAPGRRPEPWECLAAGARRPPRASRRPHRPLPQAYLAGARIHNLLGSPAGRDYTRTRGRGTSSYGNPRTCSSCSRPGTRAWTPRPAA